MRAIVVLGALALAACGSDDDTVTLGDTTFTSNEQAGTATISNAEGSITTADGAAAAKTQMPDYAPQYPGSTITTALTTRKDDRNRTNIVLTTKDGIDKVAAFYKNKFTAAGLTIASDMTTSEVSMISAEGNGKKASITAAPDEGQTSVVVSYSQ